MRKRLVRKTFDMIQEISESENKEVGSACIELSSFPIFSFGRIKVGLHCTI